MPYQRFDPSCLVLRDLAEREHDLTVDVMMNPLEKPKGYSHPHIDALSLAIRRARENGRAVILMMGAHVIRAGVGPWLIEMMKRDLITHIGCNGAFAIHDFEFAYAGATTESVARYIKSGQFGMWKQSGFINDIVQQGVQSDMGMGESIGKAIVKKNYPHKATSVLAAGYQYGVPVTVHVSIGCDFIHQHPNFDGALTGAATALDFYTFVHSVTNLQGGVFINAGTAVTGPEVYLKALSMARNHAHQKGECIDTFTTAVFDLQNLDDDVSAAPDRSDARYYFRPWKTVLARTVEDGGQSYYVRGDHRQTIPALCDQTISQSEES